MSLITGKVYKEEDGTDHVIPETQEINTHFTEYGKGWTKEAKEVLIKLNEDDSWEEKPAYEADVVPALKITNTFLNTSSFVDTPINDFLAAQNCCIVVEEPPVVPLGPDPGDIPCLWGWWKVDSGVVTDNLAIVQQINDVAGTPGRNLNAVFWNPSAPYGYGDCPELFGGALNGLSVMGSRGGLIQVGMRTFVGFPDTKTTGCTIYIVGKQLSANDENGCFTSAGWTNPLRKPVVRRHGTFQEVEGSSASTSGAFAALIDDVWKVITFRDDMTNNYIKVGVAGAEYSVPRVDGGEPYSAQPFVVFGQIAPVAPFNPQMISNKFIAEIIVATCDHDSETRAAIEDYLATKWGLS